MYKRIQRLVPFAVISFAPFAASAAPATAGSLIDGITGVFKTLIPIMLSLAMLVFFWGLVKFINHADDEKAVAEGKGLMVWGMIGIFVMVALWGIVGFIQNQLGLDSGAAVGTLPSMRNSIPYGPFWHKGEEKRRAMPGVAVSG